MSDLTELAAAAVEASVAAGAQGAWGGASRSRKVEFSVRDGSLESVSESTTQGLSLKIWADGRYSSHSTTDLRPEALARFAQEAVEMTRVLQPDPHRQIPDATLFAGRAEVDLDLVDPLITSLTREQREQLCQTQNAQLAGLDGVVSATSSTSDGTSTTAMVSSNGFQGSQEKTWLWLGSALTMREGDGLMEASMWGGAPHQAQAPTPEMVAAEALRRAQQQLGSTKGPTRKGLMIVDPAAAGRLVGRLLGPATGRAVQQGRSFWSDKVGRATISDKLVLTDEPLLPRGQSSRLYDGEGITAKPLPILADGALQNLYIDTYYGRKLGMAPTTGGPSNRIIALGSRDLAEIIADADEAIYVTSWLGGNADSTSGDFSFGMRGHLIKDGRISAPVSEMNVSGNLLTLFRQLIEVGNDPWAYSSLQTPTLVFDEVDFSGA